MFIAERMISLVAPHHCIRCGKEGSLLCPWCSQEVLDVLPSRCYKCSQKTENFAVCKTHRRLSPLRHVWILSEYDGLAKELIYALKFARASAAAETIAGLFDDNLPYFGEGTTVTHLPTATTRVRQRGYDQAALIAKAFSNKRKLSYQDTLARIGSARQVGAKRETRIKQAVGSYRNTSVVQGANILLVDDVLTTGASLESAAKVLGQAGAKEINAVVFARAI